MVPRARAQSRKDIRQNVVNEALDASEAFYTVEKRLINMAARRENGVAPALARFPHIVGVVLAIAVILVWLGAVLHTDIRRPPVVRIPVCFEPVRQTAPPNLPRNGFKAVPVNDSSHIASLLIRENVLRILKTVSRANFGWLAEDLRNPTA